MTEIVLSTVLAVLLLNLLAAALIAARRVRASSWLLVILLAGTTGAAAAAVLAVLTDRPRFLDIAVVLTGTAVLTVAVRSAVQSTVRRGGVTSEPDASPRTDEST